MANIKDWLLDAEKKTGETIEMIVVGKHDAAHWIGAAPDENVVLSREAGLRKLDQSFLNGQGGAGCFPMYAWTRSFVYFISEYDFATGLSVVPRNPINCEPKFNGE